MTRKKAKSPQARQSDSASTVVVLERQDAKSSVKIAKTFYRRTGALLVESPGVTLQRQPNDGEIFKLFFPALLALVLEPVQALVDMSIVGRLGASELGAVGLGTVTFQFALGFFGAFVFATTPLVASYASSRDNAKASMVTCRGSLVAMGVGVVLLLGVMVTAPMFMSGRF